MTSITMTIVILTSDIQSVGLVGVKDMYDELHKNLGVKLTLPRTYQILSTLGYLINTISQLKFLNTGA